LIFTVTANVIYAEGAAGAATARTMSYGASQVLPTPLNFKKHSAAS
jgi:hypothetical protein